MDQPTPQPSATQVLIKVKAAGVCHSDLHIWEGGYDLGHGRKPLSLKDRGVSLPRTMGHETVGEVPAFGPDAKGETGGLKVGDVALVSSLARLRQMRDLPRPATRTCASCKPNSLGVYCDGGYADHMTVPHPRYLLESEGARSRHGGALCCSGVTTYSAPEEGRVEFQHADRDFRRRRSRPDGAVAAEGDGRQGRHRRRYRCAQARSRRSRPARSPPSTARRPDALEQLAQRPAARSAR